MKSWSLGAVASLAELGDLAQAGKGAWQWRNRALISRTVTAAMLIQTPPSPAAMRVGYDSYVRVRARTLTRVRARARGRGGGGVRRGRANLEAQNHANRDR
jgi:hypothetical protein